MLITLQTFSDGLDVLQTGQRQVMASSMAILRVLRRVSVEFVTCDKYRTTLDDMEAVVCPAR